MIRHVSAEVVADHTVAPSVGAEASGSPAISVIVPVYNEREDVESLHAEIVAAIDAAGYDFEVIYIDDGSTDDTLRRLLQIAQADTRVTVLELRANFGQTAALAAGFDAARGRFVVPIDADRQNDPADIPRLVAQLEATPSCDVISGWRKDRQDKWLSRRLPSVLANALIRRTTGVAIHDFGCTLKAYRREVLADISLMSDMHRFLPALAVWNGAKVAERVVHHRPRLHGRTKYGLGRTVRVLLDLVTVRFLCSYMTKPLLFFGKLALASVGAGLIVMAVAVFQKYGYLFQPQGLNLNRNVLVIFAALLFGFAMQCVLLGVLSELLVRIYHDVKSRPIYRLRKKHHFAGSVAAVTPAGAPDSLKPAAEDARAATCRSGP